MKLLLPCALVVGVFGLLADNEHPNFTGTWRLDVSKSELHSKPEPTLWTIRQDNDSIAIDEQIKGRTVSMKCGTDGKSCKATPEGASGEVMFYFNGEALVETDFLGNDKEHVIKKRIHMGVDHKTMEIEVMHLTPSGPTEKWVFAQQ
jgi:hypothetical protein